MIQLREYAPGDAAAVHDVIETAFHGSAEAVLVEELREEGCVLLELVAEAHGLVVGHILFSELPIEGGSKTVAGAALAPMAVEPMWQMRGIGSALVRMGLPMLKDRGIEAVVVLGHPQYYPRFGFSAEMAEQLEAPFKGPEFMALELKEGCLDGFRGRVRYPKAFGLDG